MKMGLGASWLLLAVHLICLNAASSQFLSETEVLLQASWAAQAGWNASSGVCTWGGITCKQGQVTKM